MDSESSEQATPISEIEPWPNASAIEPIKAKSLGSTHFLWAINGFSTLGSKETSPEFKVGGSIW